MEKLVCKDLSERVDLIARKLAWVLEETVRALAEVTFLKERYSKNGEQNAKLVEDLDALLYVLEEEIFSSLENVNDMALQGQGIIQKISPVVYGNKREIE